MDIQFYKILKSFHLIWSGYTKQLRIQRAVQGENENHDMHKIGTHSHYFESFTNLKKCEAQKKKHASLCILVYVYIL